MSSTQSEIDKVIASFEKKQCTPIIDKPSFRNLIKLKNELKTNAASISSTLGGGAHGHIGLVLTPNEYHAICPTTPFVKPAQPVPPVITQAMNNYDQVRLRTEYLDQLRKFDLTNNVEKVLTNMLCAALNDVYTQGFRNSITNNITQPLHEVLSSLFGSYGQVTSDDLDAEERECQKYEHDLEIPLVVLWHKLEYLRDVAELAQIPYTMEQLMSKALRVIRDTGDLEDALTEYNETNATMDLVLFEDAMKHVVWDGTRIMASEDAQGEKLLDLVAFS